MTYDPKSKTIHVGPETDFMADSGVFFIDTLRSLAMQGGPSSIMVDWLIIEKWLECSGRELTEDDRHDIAKAWRAFLAMGIAPTPDLQDSIKFIARDYQKSGRDYRVDLPPQEVIGVFARLLGASDVVPTPSSHPPKRTSPTQSEGKSPPISPKNSATSSTSSRSKRRWIFVCGSWLVLSFGYIQIFAPFGRSFGDRYMQDGQLAQSLALMSVPIVAWILAETYKRFVR
jgi:hypothetical protein